MYQSDGSADEAEGRDGELLLRAGELVEKSGLSGLTLRSVAEVAGVSPSLLTYRFGSREALILQMFEAARLRDRAFWEGCEASVGKVDIRKTDLPGMMSGLAMQAIEAASTEQVLRWLCATQAVRTPSLAETVHAWSENGAGVWRKLLAASGKLPA